jgi:mRNA interferase MazF
VVQSDLFNSTHASVTVCPITSDCIDATMFRVSVPPGSRTGLQTPSQIMVDKVVSVPRSSIAKAIGRCEDLELHTVDDALRRWLAL